MACKRKPGPKFVERNETWWIGDDCIDRAASDVARWARTGDMSALVKIDGAPQPDVLKWRALTDQEFDQLPFTNARKTEEIIKVLKAQTWEAARMGIVSFGTVLMQREENNGVQRLSEETLYEISAVMDEPIPMDGLMEDYWRAKGIDASDKDDDEKEPAQDRMTSLVEWAGLHVLRATFLRRGKRNL